MLKEKSRAQLFHRFWNDTLRRSCFEKILRCITNQITPSATWHHGTVLRSEIKAKCLKEAVSFLSQHDIYFYFWHELLTFSIRRKMCSANSRMAPRPPLHLQIYPTAFWAAEQASAGTALRPALFKHSSSDTSFPMVQKKSSLNSQTQRLAQRSNTVSNSGN